MPEQEDILHLLMENAPDYAILMLDAAGRVIQWNTGAAHLLGWQSREIVGQSSKVFFTPEDQNAGVLEQEMRGVREHGRVQEERWHIRRDGSRFWSSSLTLACAHGEPGGCVKILRDLTERRRAEQERDDALARMAALTRAQARAEQEYKLLDAVLDALPTGVAVADPSGRLRWLNAAYKQLWNSDPDARNPADEREYIGYLHGTRHRIAPNEWPLARALRGEVCAGDLLEIENFDGFQRQVVINAAAPVRDAEGVIIASVTAQTDMADCTRVHQDLQRRLTDMERYIQRLLDSTNHIMPDIIYALFSIQHLAAALTEMEELTAEEESSIAHEIVRTTKRVQENFEDISRLMAREKNTSRIGVADILPRLLRVLRRINLDSRIKVNLHETLSPLLAPALSQSVIECVSSAVKYPDRDVDVTLSVKYEDIVLKVRGNVGAGYTIDTCKACRIALDVMDGMARWHISGAHRGYDRNPDDKVTVTVSFPLSPTPVP